ncbi:MAG: NADAR family protein [Acidobacteria bacterium]|nr:NADAR family protein [Acidobacteriota bacterium]
MTIKFYSKHEAYNEFSNFSPHGIEMDGLWYPTIEHYFQAQKFHDADYREKIRRAATPKDAKTLGRSRKYPLREDWEEIKDELMHEACLKKFRTHKELKKLLLATGDEELMENAPMDNYWGGGRYGTGQNKLGRILERVRALLRAEEADRPPND